MTPHPGRRVTYRTRTWTTLALLACSGTLLRGQAYLQITSPVDGSEVAPGQTLTVEVKATGQYQAVVIAGPDPINYSNFLTAPPYRFLLVIPANAPARKYLLSAAGFKGGGESDESVPITIDVERPDAPDALTLEPAHPMFLYIGDVTDLSVRGAFPDGNHLDLTYSTKTTYSSDTPGVVTVTSFGSAKAVGAGSANITISHRGRHITVRVVVPNVGRGK